MAGKQDYETPRWVIQTIEWRFGIAFDVDVAASKQNKRCHLFISEEDDALGESSVWGGVVTHDHPVTFWCNPPYSNVMPWIPMAYENTVFSGDECWMLLKNDSSTKWYQKCIALADEMYLITGKRISFEIDGVPDPGNNFASMLVRFRNKDDRPARVEHWDIFKDNERRQSVEAIEE